MTITHVAQAGTWNGDRRTVRWPARAPDGTGIIFHVTKDALEELMGAEGLSVEECLSTFELNRRVIEQAAESVFARGPRSDDGVYIVGWDDLNR